jgi:hypothetical protein
MNSNLITITAIFIFFIGSFEANAQKDTVFTKVSTEYGTLEQQEMATEAERLFGIHVPSKWVVKFARNFNGIYNPNFETPYDIGVEYKIWPSISLGINYSLDKIRYDFSHLINVEQRWYYQMSKRVAQGKAANNLTGWYIGLHQSVNYLHYSLPENKKGEANYGLKLRYGIQNRFKKYGFFDFSAGLGIDYAPKYNSNTASKVLTFDQTFRIGLGIFDNNKEANFSGSYCNVLRCFDEDKQMWKINGLGGVRLLQANSVYGKNTSASITPNIAFEQKLGNKPFSVEVSTNLSLLAERSNINYEFPIPYIKKTKGLSNLANLEFRWYYNQTRRIAKGKGGNNLSGPFMAVNADYRYDLSHTNTNDIIDKNTLHQGSTNLLWGYQLRFYKHGYAQLRVGGGVNQILYYHVNTIDNPRTFNIVTDLKVGYVF